MKYISLPPIPPLVMQLWINWLFIHRAGLLVHRTPWSCRVRGSQVHFLPA